MRKFLKVLVYATLLISGFTYASLQYLGLDNDGKDSFDPALETQQPDEEIGFKQVASIIGNFVYTQFMIRTDPGHLAEYRKDVEKGEKGESGAHYKVYHDLPGKSAYATRDVHRKTNGC